MPAIRFSLRYSGRGCVGEIVIDPTRFVTRLDFSRRFHEMPYLTVRPGWMAGEYFKADFILATIRTEHQGYYRRVFGHETWCEARDYPTLKKPSPAWAWIILR